MKTELPGRRLAVRSDAARAFRTRVLSWVIAQVIRLVGMTLRIRIEDRSGVLTRPPQGPMIWVFWHNRIFFMPLVYRRWLRQRAAAVLTSASGDGEIIAQVVRRFGGEAVRGSTSRRSVGAMLGMMSVVRRGVDVVVTPDGPRGPRYRLQPGLVKLAHLTGVPVFPVNVRCHRAWRLRTWDRFIIPVPFSRVDVVFEPLRRPGARGRSSDEGEDSAEVSQREGLERDRAALEALLWKE